MIVSALPPGGVDDRLRADGLVIRTGPFNFRIDSPIRSVAEGVALLYADYPMADDSEFVDFSVTIGHGSGLHRWFRPQARFIYDGDSPFEPLPANHAHPLLEWAMNWCISSQAHQYLILHAAVIEHSGGAVVLPAPPGSGKSTLCAGLIHRGWRLMSDELAMISLYDGCIVPLARPVSLKNESIDIIRRYVPGAVLSRETPDTSKGTVAHLKVPAEQVRRANEPAVPRWVVFPRYVAGAPPRLTPRPKADSMFELARNAFNYSLLGLTGFEVLGDVITSCDCYDFEYSELDDAVATFDRLATAHP